jgi:hypothetical protein
MSNVYSTKLYNGLIENEYKIREPNNFQFYDSKPSEYYNVKESISGVKTIYASFRDQGIDPREYQFTDYVKHVETKLAYNFARSLFNEKLMIVHRMNDPTDGSVIYRAKVNIVNQKHANTSNLTYSTQTKIYQLHGEEFTDSEIEEALKTHFAERFI